MQSCDVLVVGAGPTGLVAAACLKERGVDVRIVDRSSVRLDQSRALVVQPRTLELMDRMGLARAMVEAGVKTVRTNFYVDGAHLLKVPFGEVAAGQTPFPYVLFLSQVQTERILDERLAELELPIEWSTELVRVEQTADAVHARIVREGAESGIQCRWLIGADGAHSAVRKELGLPFEGDAYQSDFVLGDVRLSGIDQPLDELHVFLGRVGICALFPLEDGLTRVIATRIDTSSDEALTLADLTETARVFVGEGVELSDPAWLSRFHLHHRGVPRYRSGRCFVAGDAAHIHSPAGGQGMNTGMQDAFNLSWKLASVLRGELPEAVLDSYHDERHPVGQRLLQFTDRAFSFGAEQPQWFNTIRNWLAPHVVPRVAELGGPARVFNFVSQLGIRYRSSPMVAEDLTGADGAFKAGPRAGDRAPGDAFRARIGGQGWWLLGFTGVGDAAVDEAWWLGLLQAASAGWPGFSVQGVRDPDLHATYGLTGPGVYAIRPDGHVGFRSSGARVDPLIAWWRGLSGD